MNSRVPAQIFAPGETLKAELDSRGWSQVELAEILGRPARLISELIGGKRAITPETAKGLAAAFGTTAEFWMTLESNYQLSKTHFETSLVERRARLYRTFPVKELIRRGWIEDSKDIAGLEANVCRFYRMKAVEDLPTFQHAAKKHRYDDVRQTLQLAWLNRAEQIASTVETQPYSAAALKEAVKRLKACLGSAQDVAQAAGILSHAGVRLVVVEYLPRAKLDAACFWINRSRWPVIALSLRLDRIDNFWHTLFHEIDHVLHGEGKEAPIVDIVEGGESQSAGQPPAERRANASAANYCIDRGDLMRWLPGTRRALSRAQIMRFAATIGVHPGLVVGQLQYASVIPYSHHRDLLEKVRSRVISATPTDGFGTTYEF